VKDGSRDGSRGDIAAATQKLAEQLLAPATPPPRSSSSSSSSSSSGLRRVQQLDAKVVCISAAALSQLASYCSSTTLQLCHALAAHALSSTITQSVPDAEGCKHYSMLLYGLANAGVTCQQSQHVQQLFDLAMQQELPALLAAQHCCEPQSVSNTLMGCQKAGYTGGMRPFVDGVVGRGVGRVMAGGNQPELGQHALGMRAPGGGGRSHHQCRDSSHGGDGRQQHTASTQQHAVGVGDAGRARC